MGTVLYVSEIKSFREHFEAITCVCMYVHKCIYVYVYIYVVRLHVLVM